MSESVEPEERAGEPEAMPAGEPGEPSAQALAGFDVLEEAIGRALRQVDVWRRRAIAADRERRQLKTLLEEVQVGGGDPAALARELLRLREENRQLHNRLAEARSRVEQIEKQLHFLEDIRS